MLRFKIMQKFYNARNRITWFFKRPKYNILWSTTYNSSKLAALIIIVFYEVLLNSLASKKKAASRYLVIDLYLFPNDYSFQLGFLC